MASDLTATQTRPCLYMIVGLPCTGKSTIVRQQLVNNKDLVVASTDDFIESYAYAQDVSYNEAFANVIGAATANLNQVVRDAINNDQSVVWDQTNLTAKARRKRLNLFPSHYLKYAIVTKLETPVDLHARMVEKRPNKVLPISILEKMAREFEMPSKPEEDFDAIFLANGEQVA